MLTIRNLTKTYAKSNKKAVDNLSLELHPGEIFGFVGPNGAGKTTTIKALTGILRFEEGQIEIAGNDIQKAPLAAKREIGFVPDNHTAYDKLTGMEYLNFMADLYGVSLEARKERADRFLKAFNLEDAVNRQIKSYSHGMKQKIVVIGALIHEPKLWVLDEPMTGLDPQSAFELKEAMKEHAAKGNTVFFSSHVLEVVEKLCDRVGIIKDGRIIEVGTVEELREKGGENLEEYFLQVTADKEDA